MKKLTLILLVAIACAVPLTAAISEEPSFEVKPYTANEFYAFTKIFGEIRGPLRSQILKDKAADFETADPFNYIMKLKDSKDVKKALAVEGMTWNGFQELMGNILLSYLSIQPQKTKSAIVRQMAGYGFIPGLPEEYRPMLNELLKSKEGSDLAGMALEMALEIPEENIALARKNEKQIDRFFYTKYWKDKL